MTLHEVELKDSDIHGIEALREISNELHGDFGVSDELGPKLELARGSQRTWSEGDDVFLHLRDCQRGFVST